MKQPFIPNLEETRFNAKHQALFFEVPASDCRISEDGSQIILLRCPRCGGRHAHGILPQGRDSSKPEGHRAPQCHALYVPQGIPDYLLPAPTDCETITQAEAREASRRSLAYSNAIHRLSYFMPRSHRSAKRYEALRQERLRVSLDLAAKVKARTRELGREHMRERIP
jgi:hypothetical protein